MGVGGSKLCVGEEEPLLIFQQRRENKTNSPLHKQVSLPYTETEVLLSRVTRNRRCRYLDCELWRRTESTAPSCVHCAEQRFNKVCLEPIAVSVCPVTLTAVVIFQPSTLPSLRKKKHKQKEKPKLNIFYSFYLKYTSKIFGQIFKSNPNENENVKKGGKGVIRNIFL